MSRVRSVLLIMVLLAGAAATAHAECAWVLWLKVSEFNKDIGGHVQSFSVMRSYPTQRRCETDKPKDLEYDLAKINHICLPDTIDPRGAKGK